MTELTRGHAIDMTAEPIVYLLWNDLVGITRTRGVPKADLETKLETGLGWACAGFALTPFDTIVDNDWGPMDEVRQIPDPRSYFAYQSGVFDEAWEAVICDSKRGPTEDWDCCPRTFFRHALEDLRSDAGLTFVAGVEHEFSLETAVAAEASFSFAAARRANGVLQACAAALRSARLVPETLEPEFGPSQYEISCAPQSGMAAADSAVIARELIRAVATDHSMRASFSPLTASGGAGNGAHVHFSLVDRNGENITHDPSQPLGLSKAAAQFCAGILAHLDALVALTAPSPLSYGRLAPRARGCAYNTIGVQNRDAALRVVPSASNDPVRRRRGFNIEYRPSDGCASPYLVLGALVRAGLDGIKRGLSLPAAVDGNPAAVARAAAALPASLEAALDAFEADDVVSSWFSPRLKATYLALKRFEVARAKEIDEAALIAAYKRAY
ncbi:glutamine synthetase family protein [Segnochrobactrum spirostomi]|uniref:glutamine synthetase family protein n=1 Tax=Segnochrobactrum spirostomi TaxID=2608987 RepID=UPI001AD82E48|nr:glutamine synthetase family protein [Segnochrobactrum spirostomi]